MGHVIGPHGIRGWIKVSPYTEYVDGLLDYHSWWLNKENEDRWREVSLINGSVNGNVINAHLEGYEDRTRAAQLKGMQISFPRSCLPVLPENTNLCYNWSDLIGVRVINLHDEVLGNIVGLFESGTNDVLRISSASADTKTKEILVPLIAQYIIKIDLKLRQVTVDSDRDY